MTGSGGLGPLQWPSSSAERGGGRFLGLFGRPNREALEQGLRKLKLRHMREHQDDINELALQEEPSYMDFLGYFVVRDVEGSESKENVILLGPPGVGKTHLAVALGIEAISVNAHTFCLRKSRVNWPQRRA
jgi:hypothetical protein